MRIKIGVPLLVVGAMVMLPTHAHAQGRRGTMNQQNPMQQRVMQMDAMMQRMDHLRDRLHMLDQDLTRQRDLLRDQDRIRQHDQLRVLCQATDGVVGQLRQNMEQTRTMMANPLFDHDPEMQREMEQLRQHWELMAKQMEDGVGIMERLRERLRTPTGS